MIARKVIPVAVSLLVVLACVVARSAAAGPLTEQLRESIDSAFKVASDPELKKEARSEDRRRMLRQVFDRIFDFPEMSRRSLGRHWQERTPDEREEFIVVFGDLLESAYISKIESYSGEAIRYLGEVVNGDQAVVKTRIVTKQGSEIPVDYPMVQTGSRWRVYDVSIDGVSLIANYRSQFNSVIARSGYPELISKLKVKQGLAAR